MDKDKSWSMIKYVAIIVTRSGTERGKNGLG